MKPFPFNSRDGDKCPICETNEVKDAVLIPIAGTEEEYNAKAIQVHVDCIIKELWYYPNIKAFAAIDITMTSNEQNGQPRTLFQKSLNAVSISIVDIVSAPFSKPGTSDMISSKICLVCGQASRMD